MKLKELRDYVKDSKNAVLKRSDLLEKIMDNTTEKALIIRAILISGKNNMISNGYILQKINSILYSNDPISYLDMYRERIFDALKYAKERGGLIK
jgi:hypothetical protein